MKPAHLSRSLKPVALRRQRGASLLEGIAYLGIAAIVVLGAVSLLGTATASARANQTTEELVALRTAVRKLYAGQSYPASGTSLLPTLRAAKAFPTTLKDDGTNVTSSWGGAVSIASAGTSTFTIVYAGIPQDVCVNVLSGASGWTSVKETAASAVTAFPLTAANAITQCPDDSNDITFTGS